ncbi:MAG: hypothetical protein LBT09_06675 [Planctomycetaceae bacterium]|jgi:hypothetical protein|nr:hypothetical protein [Planctomycetaceae bacterium]
MKITQIPPQKNQPSTRKLKTVVPLTPHVDLTGKRNLTPITGITGTSNSSRKRKIVTKIARTKDNFNTGNFPRKKKTTSASISVNANVMPENELCNPAKSVARKRSYVSWPQRRKKSNPYYDTIDSLNSDTPFDADELATLDEFECIAKKGKSGAHSYAAQKQTATATTRRPQKLRRRQIDPTTCERNYSCEEVEFMNAVSEYKRSSGRMFPTCSEMLEVLKNLGYEKMK